MDKKFGFVALTILLMITGVALFFCWQQITALQNSSPEYIDQSQKDVYLSLYAGKPSKIYLVNSTASLGTFTNFVFDTDPFGLLNNGAVIGEPYVYISGTIRNDDNRTLWVPLLAYLTTSTGERLDTIVRTNGRTEFLASYLGVFPGETGNFSITVKYDRAYERQDISGYYVYLAWEPTEYPPP